MGSIWQNLQARGDLLIHWFKMATGNSYWHTAQGMGKYFVSGELRGYYNDLTAKTNWLGPVDDNGLPLVMCADKLTHFPTTVFQKALGHWDLWIGSDQQDEMEKRAFENIAQWAVSVQDLKGGWSIWPLLGVQTTSPYSAMTQGEGMSVLVRAYSIDGDESYIESANHALSVLKLGLSEGGTCRIVPEGFVLEEAPLQAPGSILNGWIFALFGVYDYVLVTKQQDACELLERSLNALVELLPNYDAGYWSCYDLLGKLASPFYHQLHIAQLRALELAFPQNANSFRRHRRIFESQASSRVGKARAIVVKGYQKLREPPRVIAK